MYVSFKKCIWKCRLENGSHFAFASMSSQWRHNEHDGISNHQCLDCLLNRLFRPRSKKTSKFCITGLCEGNSQHKGPVKRKMFPFDDFIMVLTYKESATQIYWPYMCENRHQVALAASDFKFIIHGQMANITTTSWWAWWLLKSQASRLFAQPFVQAQIKENIKAPHHWPLWYERNPPVTDGFPWQMVSNLENASIWWHHHE